MPAQQIVYERSHLQNNQSRAGRTLPSKREVLSSNPALPKTTIIIKKQNKIDWSCGSSSRKLAL
jgi:hypothetical protein